MAAFKYKREALKYASGRLKDDKNFILEAVNYHGYALNYASKRIYEDKDFVLAAIK